MSLILIVDDERNVISSLQKVLSEDGHDVITASSGESAVRVAQGRRPDLVVMDICMAGISGLEALRQLQSLYPKLPVIMMTAFDTTQVALEAIKHGAFEYLLKPFEVPTLKVVVEMALTNRS